jgi:hypothetical protein
MDFPVDERPRDTMRHDFIKKLEAPIAARNSESFPDPALRTQAVNYGEDAAIFLDLFPKDCSPNRL